MMARHAVCNLNDTIVWCILSKVSFRRMMLFSVFLAVSLCISDTKKEAESCMRTCETIFIIEHEDIEINDENIDYIKDAYQKCIEDCMKIVSMNL